MKAATLRRIEASALVMLAFVCLLCSCAAKKQPTQRTLAVGESHLAVPGGSLWYRVTGHGTGAPVVLLHGGPGFSSYYLKPFEDLGDDRQVVRYDQLGGGKSDVTTDTTLFTIEHFVAELDSLRSHLGVERWHVLGHSWGTMLALEYYRAHPERVMSLVLASAVFDVPAYERHVRELLASSPDSLQRLVKKAEATGKFDDPDYQRAMNQFYAQYVFRRPVQADLDSLFSTVNQKLYAYMQGPSEFTITGTLKHYDATSFLPQVNVPALFTAGEFDEVGPEIVQGFVAKVPGAIYAEFAGAAHITPWDARDENVKVVRAFLKSADSTETRR